MKRLIFTFWACLALVPLSADTAAGETPVVSGGQRLNLNFQETAALSGDCQAAARAGTLDAQTRQGRGAWFAGGLFLPIIMPIAAHASTPSAPAELAMQHAGEARRCYSNAYASTASGRRKSGAWIGSLAAIGSYVALFAIAGGS